MNHLSYELYKKLKDAGFPKESFYVCTACNFQQHEGGHVEYEPILDELIEACGDKFYKLENRGTAWLAVSFDVIDDDPNDYVKCIGKTAKEAVAKLYLELNKKV